MKRLLSRPGAVGRAQSETIGVALLIGVVVTLVGIVSVVIYAQVDTTQDPVADLQIEANETHITITHAGGEEFPVKDLRVVIEGETERKQFVVDAANVSGSDSTLQFGDRLVRTHGLSGRSAAVLVIHTPTDVIVAEERLDLD